MNNIYNDVSVLVKKLKDSNYTDLSTNLEHKLNVYKFAEKHLYNVFDEEGKDIIEFAHRDGDADMVDASGDLGMVETPLSVHEKVEKVFYKKPTGKYAEIETVVKMAAEALGIDLIKNAQDANQEMKELPSLEESTLSPENKAKIIDINDKIDKTQLKIENLFNSIAALFDNNFQYTENSIFTDPKIQEAFSNNSEIRFDPDYFNMVLNNKNVLTSLGFIQEKEANFNSFNSLIKEAVEDYTPQVDEETFNEAKKIKLPFDQNAILKRVVSNMDTLDRSLLPKRDNFQLAGLSFLRTNSEDASKLPKNWISLYNKYVDIVKDTFSKQYNQILNAIPKANENLTTYIKEQQEDFLSKTKFNISKIPFNQPSSSIPVASIINIKNNIPKLLKSNIANIQKIYVLFTNVQSDDINKHIETIYNILNKLENYIKQSKIDPVFDAPVMNTTLKIAYSNFNSAAKLAAEKYNDKATPSDFKLTLGNIYSAAMASVNALMLSQSSSAPKYLERESGESNFTPYGVIYNALPPEFDILTSSQTQEGLVAVSQKLLEYTNTVIAAIPKEKTSNLKFDIIKNAAVPAWPSGDKKTPAQPGQTAKPGQTNKQPTIVQGLGKANLEDPAENAVAHMQLALNNFGRMISVDSTADKFPNYKDFKTQDGLSILSTGPKSNPSLNTFDGKWSTNTNNALSIADKYVESLGLNLILGIRWDPKAKIHAGDTQIAANKNTEVLNRVNSYLAGTSPRPSSNIFDELPNTINWDIQEGPAEASLGKSWWGGKQQGIPVTRKDLSTLQSLYDFLIANNLRTPESSGQSETEIGMEGFAPSTWNETLQWFIRRAVLKYNSGSAENKNSAREYYAMVKKLFDQYKKIITYYGKKLSPGQVINPALIYQVSRNYGYSGSMQSGQFGNQFGQDPLSGFDFSRPSSGFGKQKGMKGMKGMNEMEGFKSSLFGEGEESEGVPFDNTIDFRHSSWSDFDASQLATPRLHLRDFFRINGKRMADTLFAGAQYPETSLNLYRKFLNNLQTKLHQVINQWVSETDAPGELIDNLQKFYNEWQRGIIKQKEDLARK